MTQTPTDAVRVSPPSSLTIVGFGDVGQAYARAFVNQGVVVRIYHPAPGPRALAAAQALGLAIDTDAARAFGGCALAMNVAPGPQALAVARAAAPHMPAGSVFVDLSSASPQDLRAAAALFKHSDYVDVAIMGAVSIHGHHTPLLASGAGAASLADSLAPLGFVVQVMPDSAPGDAMALKLVRSVLTKGMDAVITECLLVAQALGLREALLANIGDLDSSRLSELMAMFIGTHAPHAQRRLHEMDAVASALQGLGVPLIMIPAVQARYARTVATLGASATLPEGAHGAALYDRVLPWMLEAERRLPTTAPTETPPGSSAGPPSPSPAPL
ncbi:DUF1932 domain-containing protein [Rhodoferax sediminis]|uniref:NAD(P)-dependent oxidoreductase n=1 Tax=Rhodoferax sediminis TaxID=2509614 RepID=A0A515DA16_9BURK|nr:NAD(P)-dependent oxidoreductase [Rhodoferax sediminis]QDL37236.1 NAD(P)-dependent oxidoreductase [Rhodoferax sediminis]